MSPQAKKPGTTKKQDSQLEDLRKKLDAITQIYLALDSIEVYTEQVTVLNTALILYGLNVRVVKS